MVSKVVNKIKAWSYSRYSNYIKCPFKLKCSAILKIKEPSNYAMDRGTAIHSKGEQYLLGGIRGIPKEYNLFGTALKAIKLLGAVPEVDLAVDRKWSPSAGDAWDSVWCRAKVDADVSAEGVATLIDYKTGRVYPTHEEQGELYSVCKFAHAPDIKHIDVEFWYLDSGEVGKFAYERKDFEKLKRNWVDKTKKMLSDTKFLPTPGTACNRCYYSSKHGSGPCKF